MLPFFYNPEKERLKLLTQAKEENNLKKYLKHPFPDLNKTASEIDFLSIDFETTGLDAKKEAILSIGYTVISNGKISLNKNKHHFIKVNREIPPSSVIIHKITDDRAKQGAHLHDVLEELLSIMAGKVLLVHFDKIEKNFLKAACKEVYGIAPPFLIVDTLHLAMRRLDRLGPYAPERLRLFNLREEYGLPRYKAHSALEDAIATAELFLAQIAHADGLSNTKLKSILKK